jgi:amidase
MNQLLRSSAYALAGAIRSGEVSSEEVVGAHIKRVEEVNPRLNAVAQLTAETALARAREAPKR